MVKKDIRKKIILSFVLLMQFSMVRICVAKVDWNEYKGKHFIVYYDEAPLSYVKEVEKTAEQYYNEISRNLGFTRYKNWSWDDRAKIYIYNGKEHYHNTAKTARWSHGVASPRDRVIRTFPSDHGFFDSTLPHELGHIIFREFIGFKSWVPLWFEEGIAMNQEKARRWGAHKVVRAAIDNGTFIPLDKLTLTRLTHKSSQEKVALFYAESASVVYYLLEEQGKHRFVRFCKKLQKGGNFEWNMESVYYKFKNYEELNKAWVKYLTQ